MAFKLSLGQDLDTACRQLAVKGIDEARKRLSAQPDEREAAIHDARKTLKKLRALVKLARPSLDGQYKVLNGSLRDIARGLSAVRDATALIECLDRLEAAYGRRLCEGSLSATRRVLVGRRDAVHEDTDAVISQMVAGVEGLRRVRRVAKRADWPSSGSEFRADYKASYRACRKAWKAVRKSDAPEAAHEWRKRTKLLGAQVGLLRDRLDADLIAWRKALLVLAARLGEHHDLAVLEDALAGEAAIPAQERKLLSGLIVAEQQAIREAVLRDGETLLSEKPKHFVAKLFTDAG